MVSLDHEGALFTLRFLPPYMASDEDAYLGALGEVGRCEQPFALLAIFGGGGKLSPAGERAQNLWFKTTRAAFERNCRAIALVRPGATPKMEETFRKLWSMPLTVAEGEADGRDFIARHMATP